MSTSELSVQVICSRCLFNWIFDSNKNPPCIHHFISDGFPTQITRPSYKNTSFLQYVSASSREWVDTMMVRLCASSWIAVQTLRRAVTSSPDVGSSKSSMPGLLHKLQATDRRRFQPPESVDTFLSRCCLRPRKLWSITWLYIFHRLLLSSGDVWELFRREIL